MKERIFIVLIILLGRASLIFSSEDERVHFRKEKRLNVILIVIDALRADHLSCYGYSRNTSPNIDKFAKESTLFMNAFSHGPATRVAMPSLFTSLYPGVHKVFKIGASLSREFLTLPEILRAKGYATAAFVGPQLESIPNFDQGFQIYEMIPKVIKDPPPFERSFIITKKITRKALDWLENNYSQPFFLYMHYLDPHAVYLPPSPYNKLFWQKEITKEMRKFAISFIPYKEFNPLEQGLIPKNDMFDFIISQYDGEVRYVDEHIKLLLERIEGLGLSKNTLIILTSDHGEEFLDHGNFFHDHHAFYNEIIHIPLVMRLPGIILQDRVISHLVRHIDITPTVLDILDIEIDSPMQGISLIPLIKGKAIFKLDSFSEHVLREKHIKAIRTEKLSFIETYDFKTNSYSYELYDLDTDSKELNNLAENAPREIGILRTRLNEYTINCEKIRKSILKEDSVEESVILDEETRERLKSLGYLQ